MADNKPTKKQLAEFALQSAAAIAKSPQGKQLLDETLFSFRAEDLAMSSSRGRKEIKVKDAAATAAVAAKAYDLYAKGKDSEVTSEMANALVRYVDLLPSGVKARAMGSFSTPGGSVSAPVGRGRAGLKMPDFKNPETASAFYEDPDTRVDVDSRSISAQRNLGKAGPFDMSASGRVDRSGNAYAGIRGSAKFAKGGHVKKYTNASRKPRLK